MNPNLSRRDLLSAAGALSLVGAAAPSPSTRRLLVVICSGGWDTAYCIDPKQGVPTVDNPRSVDRDNPDDVELVETFSGIPVAFNDGRRPSVSQFFESYGSRACVVNGLWMGGVSHMTNIRKILTGTSVEGHPDFATIASTELGADLDIGHVSLVQISLAGQLSSRLVRVGATGQLRSLLGTDAPYAPPSFVLDPAQGALVNDFRASRLERLRASRGGVAPGDTTLDLVGDSWARRPGLEAMAESLDLAALSGGADSFEYQLALAGDLFRRDLCRVVSVSSPSSWDSHVLNNTIQSDNLEELFGGLLGLMTQLELDGLLDTTTIAITSEMTRTPLLNEANGKDHWPVVGALVVGGDVRGGRVIGGTTDSAEPLAVNGTINDYGSFAAGMLSVLGVDPEPWLPGVARLELG